MSPSLYETMRFVQKELQVLGSRNALPHDSEEVLQMLEQKRFPVDAAISDIVKFGAVPEVLAAWDANPSRFMKIIVSLD